MCMCGGWFLGCRSSYESKDIICSTLHTSNVQWRDWSVTPIKKEEKQKAHSGTWPMTILKYFWDGFPGAGNALWLALWLWLGSLSFQTFLLFRSLFLLKFSPHVCYTFCSSPTDFGYSVSFLFSDFVLFTFQFWRFLLISEVSSSSHILSSATSRVPMSPSEAFFICFSVFNPLHYPFGALLGFPSLCLHCSSVLACCLLYPLACP